jgi:hypothetical protein
MDSGSRVAVSRRYDKSIVRVMKASRTPASFCTTVEGTKFLLSIALIDIALHWLGD